MNNKIGMLGIMVANAASKKAVLNSYLRVNPTGLRLFCFTPSDINWEQQRINGLHRVNKVWRRRLFHFPQVILNRCYDLSRSFIHRLESVIGHHKCFNHQNHLGKLDMHEHLSNGLPSSTPHTLIYNEQNASELLAAHKVIYMKPNYGNKGLGVYRAELKDSGEIHIGEHHLKPLIIAADMAQFHEVTDAIIGSTPYIVQQGVHIQTLTGRTFDIRILVQKNKTGSWSITSAISRVAFSGCFNTSIFEKMCVAREALQYLYSPDAAQAQLHTSYMLSLLAAEAIELRSGLHLAEISVDLAIDEEDHLWIIEVNGMPQKSLYRSFQSYRNAYRRPLEYAAYLYER
ncbi:YheC/YheD family protein [Paenibacillus sp. GCM10023252]|uniref:YheC/YheD family protein n=1 Tax=Paenibacillus sp. GCM10023252 TaxID=3252649 RepID=UPI003607D531